jgi:fibronectin type 3 domain-containing protein
MNRTRVANFSGPLARAICWMWLACGAAQSLHAATWYVATNGSDSADGTSWATAKATIQAAADQAISNDTVLVSNGVYATGARVVSGLALANRVAITNAITVRSLHGPAATIIRGGGPNGPGAVRCAYLGRNAILSGFTLTNGATQTAGVAADLSGGGASGEDSGQLTNCVVSGNTAHQYGGGVYRGRVFHSVLSGNRAGHGGAAYASTITSSVLWTNSASFGGGCRDGVLQDCLLSDNQALTRGGGAYDCQLDQCTLSGNVGAQGGGGASGGTLTQCTLASNASPGQVGGGAEGATLKSCTLTGNSADLGGGTYYGSVSNCTFSANTATTAGGGAYGGTLRRCRLSGNLAGAGAGAHSATLINCELAGNVAATFGGGTAHGTLNSCTVHGNTAGSYGGGSAFGTQNNCVVYFNAAALDANAASNTMRHCCSTPLPSGAGNIAADPQFANPGAGNFRLAATSPCIDAGSNAYVQGTGDLDELPRIVRGTVDMGAYEYPFTELIIPPVGVQASDGEHAGRIRVTWTPAIGASAYEVWMSASADPGGAILVSTNLTTNTCDYLTTNITSVLFFRVKAVYVTDPSAFSAYDTGFARIPAPTGVAATDGAVDFGIGVSWNAVSGADGYQLWRHTNDNSAQATLLASSLTTNAVVDAATAGGSLYYYWVTASNALSTSSLSASNSGFWVSPPSAVAASDGLYADHVAVSWLLPPGLSSASVWRGTSPSPLSATRIADNVAGNAYADTNAAPGLPHYYWVKSGSPLGSSDFSASDTGYRALPPPSGVAASDGLYLDKIVVTWGAVSNAGSYEVWRALTNDAGAAMQVAAGLTALNFNDTLFSCWQTNYYWVRAAGLGPSGFSAPDAGSGKEVEASDNTFSDLIRVSWCGPDGATTFEVWRNAVDELGSASMLTGAWTSTSFDDLSALPGQPYFYWVRPTDGTQVRFSTSDAGIRSLAPPAIVVASDGTSTAHIDVAWSAVTGATSYEVWRNTTNSAGTAVRIATNLAGTAHQDGDRLPSVLYYYWIRAVSALSASSPGASDSGYVAFVPPQAVAASDGDFSDRVVVTWLPVAGADEYEAWRNTVDDTGTASLFADHITGAATADLSRDAATPRYYWVRAKNAVSTSAFGLSDAGFATPLSTQDADGDGVSDAAESAAGTDWHDDGSFLRIVPPVAAPPAGTGFVITWTSESNRIYGVQGGAVAAGGVFSNLVSGLPATPPLNVCTDVHAVGAGPYFYRIRVE